MIIKITTTNSFTFTIGTEFTTFLKFMLDEEVDLWLFYTIRIISYFKNRCNDITTPPRVSKERQNQPPIFALKFKVAHLTTPALESKNLLNRWLIFKLKYSKHDLLANLLADLQAHFFGRITGRLTSRLTGRVTSRLTDRLASQQTYQVDE